MPKVNVKKGTVRVGSAAKGDVKHVKAGDDANPINLSKPDADKLIARGVVESAEGGKKVVGADAEDGGEA